MAQTKKIKANSIGIFTFVLGVSVLTGSEYKCVVSIYIFNASNICMHTINACMQYIGKHY